MYTSLKRLLLIILVFVSFSCANNKTKHPIKVGKSFAQSWTTLEGKSRGNHVEITLEGKVNEIKVLGVVYNKQQVTPIVEILKDKSIVRADFEIGTEKVFETPTATLKQNMIIYSYKGKTHELPLNNIIRKNTQYYPTK